MRLIAWTESLIESGLLVVAATIPVFFNIFSNRAFEPDKLTMLRSLAVVMVLAWTVGAFAPSNIGTLPRFSLRTVELPVLAALGLAAVYLVTTALSIGPRLSFWGSYQRLEGTYTLLAYVAVFLLAIQLLRSRAIADRLISAILLASVPVALYGFLQRFGLDPIQWSGTGAGVTERVVATMGNSIFVSACLIMVVPLTLARFVAAFQEPRVTRSRLNVAYYLILLVVQLLTIYFSQSRGPFLGLLAGLIFFGLLYAVVFARPWALRAMVALPILVVVALVALSVIAPALGENSEAFTRIFRVLDTQSSTGQERILAWGAAEEIFTSNPARAIVGYGPETMILTFNQHFPPRLAAIVGAITFDRAHNDLLDTLATTGLLGLAAYLFLWGSLLVAGFRALGLVPTGKLAAQSNVPSSLSGRELPGSNRSALQMLIGLPLALGLAGIPVLSLMLHDSRLAPLGFALGALAGVVVYLASFAHGNLLRLEVEPLGGANRLKPQPPGRDLKDISSSPLLLIGLLAALVAHFVELQFGIAVAATNTQFWLYAGLLVALTRREELTAPVAAKKARKPSPPPIVGAASPMTTPALSVLTGYLLAALGFSLINPEIAGQRVALLVLFFSIWVLAGLGVVSAGPAEGRDPHAGAGDPLWTYSLLSLGTFLALVVPRLLISRLLPDPTAPFFIQFAGMIATLLVVAGFLVCERHPAKSADAAPRPLSWPVAGLAAVLALAFFWLHVTPVRADIYFNQGVNLASAGQIDQANDDFRRALAVTPRQDYYTIYAAGGFVEKARASSGAERTRWLEQARQVLEVGEAANPRNPDPVAKMALLHRYWAELSSDPATRQAELDRAKADYERAATLAPNNPKIYSEWGEVYALAGDYAHAIDRYEHALALWPEDARTNVLLGDAYVASDQLDRAAEAYGRAVKIDDKVIQQQAAAVQNAPDDWNRRQGLALMYQAAGQPQKAQETVQTALRAAPPDQAARLQRLAARLQTGSRP